MNRGRILLDLSMRKFNLGALWNIYWKAAGLEEGADKIIKGEIIDIREDWAKLWGGLLLKGWKKGRIK